MTGDQDRDRRIGTAAWAFKQLLDEVVTTMQHHQGREQDDARVAAYSTVLERNVRGGQDRDGGPGRA